MGGGGELLSCVECTVCKEGYRVFFSLPLFGLKVFWLQWNCIALKIVVRAERNERLSESKEAR